MSGLSKFLPLRALFALVSTCAIVSVAQAQRIEARFEPQQISAGGTAFYVLTVHDSARGTQVNVPQVAGLERSGNARTSNVINIINGVRSSQEIVSLPYSAAAEGSFTIPSFTVQSGGKQITVPAATLHVLPADEVAAANDAALGKALQLQIQAPEGPYYVGQAIPVTLVLNIDPRVTIAGSSGISKAGSDNYVLSQPVELGGRQVSIDSQTFNQYRFGLTVTPLSSGEMELSFTQVMAVHMPQQANARRQTARDPFEDFFNGNSLFERMMNREEVRLQSNKLALQALPLPAEGKPASFSGAIGEFELGAPVLSASTVAVGEPITLLFAVTGNGNFDRIQPPTIADSAQWRSYSPQVQLQPLDPTGITATKSFEYTLIPRTPEITQTPAIEFSYFNPQSGRYVTLELERLPLTVTGQAPQTPASTTAAVSPRTAAEADSLRPLMPEPASTSGSEPVAWFTRPVFYALQLIPAAALTALVVYRRHVLRLRRDPLFARRHRAESAVRRHLRDARRHADAEQAAAFYASACAALQEQIAANEPDVEPSSLTWPEIQSRLHALQINTQAVAQARVFAEATELLQYGGSAALAPASLQVRLAELNTLLPQIKQMQKASS